VYDLIVRGGRIVDGTGRPGYQADVGVRDGTIAAIGAGLAAAESAVVVEAGGSVVTPGFVDVHTHFDGQATWDEVLEPATSHGVTTVVMGNCGVGFAPVRPGGEQQLVELMEGVEDIPGSALHEGMSWGWESFSQYLDVLDGRRWSVDVATQLPHGPLRAYVMGDRAVTREPATSADIAEMARLATAAVEAGALGFTTSRTLGHTALDGTPVPGTFAADDELLALAKAVRDGGGGVFEVAGAGIVPADDPATVARELDWIGRMASETGLTASFILLQQHADPRRWERELEAAAGWRDRGAAVVPLVAGRPFGVLLGWDVRHPFRLRPSYEAVRHLPLADRVEELRRPGVRRRILAEEPSAGTELEQLVQQGLLGILPQCYVLAGAPDYEPPPEQSLGALAAASGAGIEAIAYDALCRDGGEGMLLFPMFNYADGDHAALLAQFQDPVAVLALGDAGAHCGAICDASIPTYLLTHWVRDRTRGPRISLEDAVRRLTSQTADLYGFADRGRIEVGLRADLNVIDTAGLELHAPGVVHDLPAGGTRILQGATGYRATIVAGELTRRDGLDTGARPGRLRRGTR
jgi:N-acyl-D-aspartate/D-glutamate deacylase